MACHAAVGRQFWFQPCSLTASSFPLIFYDVTVDVLPAPSPDQRGPTSSALPMSTIIFTLDHTFIAMPPQPPEEHSFPSLPGVTALSPRYHRHVKFTPFHRNLSRGWGVFSLYVYDGDGDHPRVSRVSFPSFYQHPPFLIY
jgi:hypothetical protein